MSKKLEGNGLWESSRMMLPQHKEQSVLRQGSPPAGDSEPLTSRELEMIREYILLPVVLSIVEQKRQEVERSAQTLKSLYASAAKIMILDLRKDIHKLKSSLLEKNIRVVQDSRDEYELNYRYIYRGQTHQISMTRDYLKNAVGIRISQYVSRLIASMQQNR
ncbi:hypothetical protein [Paenibacillus sp. CAA11]|uniref:hypothetical protein n=1 Tax=Paenibacillus sp. CAA11 TaxID=1532905 RepID=UPI001901E398|nr:hypothetical protein [Paenibacillus sp. CAA11]